MGGLHGRWCHAVLARLAPALGLAGLAVTCLPSAGRAAPCLAIPSLRDKCEAWVSVYDDPTITQGSDQMEPVMAVSPDGSRVYVAAIDEALNTADPYHSPATWAVMAYDGGTGARLWYRTYQGPGHYDRPNAIAVAPDGKTLYVTGGDYNDNPLSASARHLLTIAYDASSGDTLWQARNPDDSIHDVGTEVVVSPAGDQVYVVANIEGGTANRPEIDWAAVAYSALDGNQLWRTTYTGLGIGKDNSPQGAALSPGGDLLYVTGESGGSADYDVDYATVAYATGGATPGRQTWEARYDGVGKQWPDRASGIAVDPHGRVIVTGDSISDFTVSVSDDYATVAYDGATGGQLWDSRYKGPAGGIQFGMAVAAARESDAPSGGRDVAVVTGESEPSKTAHTTDWATLAYDTSTGEQLWVQRLSTPGDSKQFPKAIAMSPDGTMAYVTGFTGGRNPTPYSNLNGGEAVTQAYRLSDGTPQWTGRYAASPTDTDTGMAIGVSPQGMTYVSAQVGHNNQTDQSNNKYDIATMAYAPSQPPPGVPEAPTVPLLALVGGALALGVGDRARRWLPVQSVHEVRNQAGR